VLLPLGVRPRRDGVVVTDDGRLRATLGFLRLETPLTNLAGGHVTTSYRWYTAIGARLSLADDGLTFGTNTERGACIHFRQRVGPVLGPRRHSALTVTVEDCEGLLDLVGRDDR
jgi:hypothetical protein